LVRPAAHISTEGMRAVILLPVLLYEMNGEREILGVKMSKT
jgi:hypothetical protein